LAVRQHVGCTTVVTIVRMATVEDDQATVVSQQAPTVVTQILTELVDVSQMGGQSLADFIAEHGNMDEPGDSQETQESLANDGDGVVAAAVAERTNPPPAKKRKRMVFANKKLLGRREQFLLPEFTA